ncbi:MAG: hypothetical protein V5A61_09750, partial [Haloarculaceae archaeon]
MSPQGGEATGRLLQAGGLVRFLLEAPLRVILVVAGVALVLAAGGLKIEGRFEPDATGRQFMGVVGVVLVVTGLLVHVGLLVPDGGGIGAQTPDSTVTAGTTPSGTATDGSGGTTSGAGLDGTRTDDSTGSPTDSDPRPATATDPPTDPPTDP